jgi:hypothetical protein
MYAKLSEVYGWAWQYEDGTLGPFILHNVERYAGMIAGYTTDGRKCTRPRTEFDALSYDGRDWKPVHELLAELPEEQNVRPRKVRDLQLPPEQDQT